VLKLSIAILSAIYSVYLFYKLVEILSKYENPEKVFFSNKNDFMENTNPSPDEKLNALKYLIRLFIFVIISSLLFSCKKKPENLLNRIGGDAHLVEKSSFEFKDSLSILNYNLGITELRNRNLKEAKKYFNKSLLREPENSSVLNSLGSIEANFGNFKKSYEYFEKSLKLNKTNTLTYMSYGVALNKSTEQKKAIEIWKKGLSIERNIEKTGIFNYNIANAFYKLDNYNESKKHNDLALKIVTDKEIRKDIIELEELLNNWKNK
jgi:tetratricopeptide (TPR) repeat protein